MKQRLLEVLDFSSEQSFLSYIEAIRVDAQQSLLKENQIEFAQFFTPLPISKLMASMFSDIPSEIRLVDPGAGIGNLTAAFVSRAIFSDSRPNKISISAFEIDSFLVVRLKSVMEACKLLCNQHGVELNYEIHQEDFLSSLSEKIFDQNSLFSNILPTFNFAILNPPYKKINSKSRTRNLLSRIGIETTNLYSAFLWLTIRLLEQNGEVVGIIPRSFCNGAYFAQFRSELLRVMSIRRIHIFEARNKAFSEDDVLQENIILYAKKTENEKRKILISSSDNPDEGFATSLADYDQIVQSDDPHQYIRIIPDMFGHVIGDRMKRMVSTSKELGITISTGPVVDFRSRNLLSDSADPCEIIPMIYPANLQEGLVVFPRAKVKKPAYLKCAKEVDKLAVPASFYVFVKRFSSKEENRRVYAAVFDPAMIKARRIGIENHINYFRKSYGEMSAEFAKGLALFLNSTLVDQYFRQFSGHTQVNANDLRQLRYPSQQQLISIGGRVTYPFPDQNEIDRIVSEELDMSHKPEDNELQDPILVKKRIKEALRILQSIRVPRAQQNDRSALTLLALTNMRPTTQWSEAASTLLGITEMMDYFRGNFGVNYAPNTRETIRRQTIHQFLQMGITLANPDNPMRPINSPHTRYVIDPIFLDVVRSYGSTRWNGNVENYLHRNPLLGSLELRERPTPLIPVTLPSGENLMISSGGQNELIKKVVEEFCPRFTPGGQVVYLGDAGAKVTEGEMQFFEKLGVNIEKHGKLPDVVVFQPDKNWLILIEAVTSHGPIDVKRHNELSEVFKTKEYGLVFVTAFESRHAMHKYLNDIAWETEVWVAESPSHLIHFDGERFLGPYPD